MNFKTYVATITILIILTSTSGFILIRLFPKKITYISPVGKELPIPTQIDQKYTIIGFLPYWNLKYSNQIKPQLLTHIAYFGISITPDGKIETELEDGTKELGHYRLTNPELIETLEKLKQSGGKPLLVVRAMSNERIQAALNPQFQTSLIEEIITIASSAGFQGINIDFEPDQPVQSPADQHFTDFVSLLSRTCKVQISNCQISVDMYASVINNPRIWDLNRLPQVVDHIIVMGYDFVQTSSSLTGPHAPMYGSPYRWKYDIHTTITHVYQIIPPEKIVLSVPYYGYEWTSKSAEPGGTTISRTGKLATYTRTRQLLEKCQSPTCQQFWDQDALTPYIVIQNSQTSWQQIWYEDARSLSFKYQLIKQYNLAGAAIWALGYDAPYTDLWMTLEENFTLLNEQ